MKILFICTGNVCRSPAAACVLKQMLASEGVADIEVESAGTLDWGAHPRDGMMARIAFEHGYRMEGESRPMTRELLDEADLIIVMTPRHQEEVKEVLDSSRWDRIHLFMAYCFGENIPLQDPVSGSEFLFRSTFEKIERGCIAIVENLNHPCSRIPVNGET